jgi:hypothetical protein
VYYLPPSLQELQANRQAVLHYDFKSLVKLKRLELFMGKTAVSEMYNLGEQVEFDSYE